MLAWPNDVQLKACLLDWCQSSLPQYSLDADWNYTNKNNYYLVLKTKKECVHMPMQMMVS